MTFLRTKAFPYKTQRFAELVNGFWVLTIFAIRAILDVWHSSEYVPLCSKHKKSHLMDTKPAITYSKLTTETLEQGVKYVQS